MSVSKIDPSILKQSQEAVTKHGSLTKAAKALGIARSTLARRLQNMPKTSAPKVGKSLADFQASHDKDYIVPNKIKAALQELGEGWSYETDFLRLAGVSVTDLALYRDSFSPYWLVVDRSGKRVWAGSKAMADKMREMIRG
jgi:hypothetical protein